MSEKQMYENLHQILLVDNGVANLLDEMKKINEHLGLIEDYSD